MAPKKKRLITLLTSISLLLQTAVSEISPADTSNLLRFLPFVPPQAQSKPLLLFKRGSCPSNTTSCSSLNAPDACCPAGTNCALDQQGNIACCPVNNYCTGYVGSSGSTDGTATQTSSLPAGYTSVVTVTSTAGVTGVTTTAPASISGSAVGGGSTVPNAYYPFVYMPTSFGNAAVCSQYYTSCQAASTACFQSLVGANGVTISGMAGGTTQVGGSGILQATASSICSSLSQSACYRLQGTQCAQFGTTGSKSVQAGKGPRQTGCGAMIYVAAAGAAAGAMGMAV